ncbi:MAG TPA: metallopeptidase family protein [Polyangiales bacterium]
MNDALTDEDLDELEELLSELELCLAEGDLEGARSVLEAAEEMAGPEDPDVRYGRALIAQETGDVDTALTELKLALEADPDFADAHYALALLYEEMSDQPSTVHHFLRTRALDSRGDKERNLEDKAEIDRIERVARETLESLPPEFAERLRSVPILLEPRPSRQLVETGFDPRAYGLFEGPEHGRDDVPAPTRIVLYTSNLLGNFSGDELEEQVETTVLHEVGHYFGLEEEDMERLGLA